ncbi:LysR family transcriptional regulator [Streptomyces sp. S1D4-11]
MSAAARQLRISQPALSQKVGALERQLGLRLLIRSSTGVRPTEEGNTLLVEARDSRPARAGHAHHDHVRRRHLRRPTDRHSQANVRSRDLADFISGFPEPVTY